MYNEYLIKANSVFVENNHVDTAELWSKHENLWPELAAYAKHILTVPVTSAPVERVFSIGGYILEPRRRCINDILYIQ